MGKRPPAAGSKAASKKANTGVPTASRSLSEVVAQAIRDNFKNWDPELLDAKKVDDMTLRERLTADKEAWLKNGGVCEKFGGTYYLRIKALYRSDEDPIKLLQIVDPNMIVQPPLMRAMVKCYHNRPDRGVLHNFLQSAREKPNEKKHAVS